jgi:hypothetical protein
MTPKYWLSLGGSLKFVHANNGGTLYNYLVPKFEFESKYEYFIFDDGGVSG